MIPHDPRLVPAFGTAASAVPAALTARDAGYAGLGGTDVEFHALVDGLGSLESAGGER